MDVHAAMVDQRITTLIATEKQRLAGHDPKLQNDVPKLRSRAFVALCVQALLDIPIEEAFDLLTDASHDLAIDALYLGDRVGDEFEVVLFQGKYKKRLDGEAHFGANEVLKMVQTVSILFDPSKTYDQATPLAARIEEIRALIGEGAFPNIRVVLCNNGKRWKQDGDAHIAAAGFDTLDQVCFEHFNHRDVVEMLKAPQPVNDTLRLSGAAIVEDFNFRRVMVGKMRVSEVADLLNQHGDKLLDRNIRRYLGLRNNRVNKAIAATLKNPEERQNFYFFNNGITFTCNNLRYNALQGSDFQARVDGLQIINGGQTCVTIQRTLASLDPADFAQTYVIVRLYELADDDKDIVHSITYATNSQNPVDLRDLRANDDVQRQLEVGLADLGYTYLRKRGMPRNGKPVITPKEAAEASMAVLQGKPHIARFQSGSLFGKRYHEAFPADLVPAQIAFAVELVRKVKACAEKGVLREPIEGLPDPPRWLPYGQLTIAALAGAGIQRDAIDHRSLGAALTQVDRDLIPAYRRALDVVDVVLLAGGVDVQSASLQKLSGAFRSSLVSNEKDELLRRARDIRKTVHASKLEANLRKMRENWHQILGALFPGKSLTSPRLAGPGGTVDGWDLSDGERVIERGILIAKLADRLFPDLGS